MLTSYKTQIYRFVDHWVCSCHRERRSKRLGKLDEDLMEELDDSPFPQDKVYDSSDNKDWQETKIEQDIEVKDLSENTLFLLKIMNLMILFYPMMACAYSKAIFDCRGFSVP